MGREARACVSKQGGEDGARRLAGDSCLSLSSPSPLAPQQRDARRLSLSSPRASAPSPQPTRPPSHTTSTDLTVSTPPIHRIARSHCARAKHHHRKQGEETVDREKKEAARPEPLSRSPADQHTPAMSSSSQPRRRGRPSALTRPRTTTTLLAAAACAACAALAACARAAQPDPMPAARFEDVPVPRFVPASSRPQARFTSTVNSQAATSASVLIPVTLDASSSSSSAQRFEWTVLRWRQDQDVGASVRRLQGRTVTVDLAPNYTYAVDLTVTDGSGEKGFAAGPVWVPPQDEGVASRAAAASGPQPKVVISSPQALQTTSGNGAITLDGSQSKLGNSGAALTSYAWRVWRLTDGEKVLDLPASASPVARNVLLSGGAANLGTAFTIELTVKDAKGNVGVGSVEAYVGRPGKPIPATSGNAGV